LEDGGVLEEVNDEGSYEARSNPLGAIAVALLGFSNTVDSANKITKALGDIVGAENLIRRL
jgi:hypothetical protein